jgi:hypothetical protein
MKLPLTLIIILIASTAHAERLHPESHYRDIWCKEHYGKTEVQLEGRTRADCVTDSYAIEIEFADKWKEAIGQSLWYAMQTGKDAGIVLIVEGTKHNKNFNAKVHSQLPIGLKTYSSTFHIECSPAPRILVRLVFF